MNFATAYKLQQARIAYAECMKLAEQFQHNPVLMDKFLNQAIKHQATIDRLKAASRC